MDPNEAEGVWCGAGTPTRMQAEFVRSKERVLAWCREVRGGVAFPPAGATEACAVLAANAVARSKCVVFAVRSQAHALALKARIFPMLKGLHIMNTNESPIRTWEGGLIMFVLADGVVVGLADKIDLVLMDDADLDLPGAADFVMSFITVETVRIRICGDNLRMLPQDVRIMHARPKDVLKY